MDTVLLLDPEEWSEESRPEKAKGQLHFVGLIQHELGLTKKGRKLLEVGLNVVDLLGPNVWKSYDLHSSILGQKGTLYSAENMVDVFKVQRDQLEMMGVRRCSIQLRAIEYMDLAREVLALGLPTALLMDFCSTIKCEWEGSLGSMGELIQAATCDRIFMSLTHYHDRHSNSPDPTGFFMHRIPEYWENHGWIVRQKHPASYQDKGKLHMNRAAYSFEREK